MGFGVGQFTRTARLCIQHSTAHAKWSMLCRRWRTVLWEQLQRRRGSWKRAFTCNRNFAKLRMQNFDVLRHSLQRRSKFHNGQQLVWLFAVQVESNEVRWQVQTLQLSVPGRRSLSCPTLWAFGLLLRFRRHSPSILLLIGTVAAVRANLCYCSMAGRYQPFRNESVEEAAVVRSIATEAFSSRYS